MPLSGLEERKKKQTNYNRKGIFLVL